METKIDKERKAQLMLLKRLFYSQQQVRVLKLCYDSPNILKQFIDDDLIEVYETWRECFGATHSYCSPEDVITHNPACQAAVDAAMDRELPLYPKIMDLLNEINSQPDSPSVVEETNPIEDAHKIEPTVVMENIKFSDVDYADAVDGLYGNNFKWCALVNKWFCWNGKKWDYKTSQSVNKAAENTTIRVWNYWKQKQCPESEVKMQMEMIKNAYGRKRATAIDASIKQFKNRVECEIDDFDHSRYLLNMQNFIIDMKTGQPMEHDRKYNMTKIGNVNYDKDAQCPKFLKFMDRVCCSNEELIDFIQRLCGSALIGEQLDRIFPMLHGSGKNGKTTLITIISEVIGEYAGKIQPKALATNKADGDAHSEAIANLRGLRFIACDETDDGDRLNESLVKRLTGGDIIRARKIYSEEIEFKPQCTLIMDTNHKPAITNGGKAIWDRMCVIPFLARIEDDEKITNYGEKLVAEEGSGILNWLIAGALRWQVEGLDKKPQIVIDATEAYQEEEHKIGRFLDECCTLGRDEVAQSSNLYEAYKNWTRDNGYFAESIKKFRQRLEYDFGIKYQRQMQGRMLLGVSVGQTIDQKDLTKKRNDPASPVEKPIPPMQQAIPPDVLEIDGNLAIDGQDPRYWEQEIEAAKKLNRFTKNLNGG